MHRSVSWLKETYHTCIGASRRTAAHRCAAHSIVAGQGPTVVGNAKLLEDVAAWWGQGSIHIRFWGSSGIHRFIGVWSVVGGGVHEPARI